MQPGSIYKRRGLEYGRRSMCVYGRFRRRVLFYEIQYRSRAVASRRFARVNVVNRDTHFATRFRLARLFGRSGAHIARGFGFQRFA